LCCTVCKALKFWTAYKAHSSCSLVKSANCELIRKLCCVALCSWTGFVSTQCFGSLFYWRLQVWRNHRYLWLIWKDKTVTNLEIAGFEMTFVRFTHFSIHFQLQKPALIQAQQIACSDVTQATVRKLTMLGIYQQ
jgi:hypothetical protein